jgi:hypothetical protein
MNNKKQLVLCVAVLAMLSFLLTSCNETGKKDQPQKVDAVEINAPNNIISLQEADDIYNNYTKHRVAAIESYEAQERASEEAFEAARFVSYDIETIKNYIKFVEQESKKAGVTPNTLRFYFANYPDKNNFPSGKKVVHKKQNSIFILPTLSEKGEDYGYYIGSDGKAKYIKDWKANLGDGTEKLKSKSEASFLPSFSNTVYSNQSLILNRGQSGPPPYPDF